MSTYEDDHPTTSQPDGPEHQWTIDEILEELEAGGEDVTFVDSQGRRLVNERIFQLSGQSNRPGASAQYIKSLKSLQTPGKFSGFSKNDHCPICQTQYSLILDEEEHALALDSPAIATESLGVVKVGECGHIFCRRDASKWLQKNNSCPLCRKQCDPSVTAGPVGEGAQNAHAMQEMWAQMMAEAEIELAHGGGGGGSGPRGGSRREEEEVGGFGGMYS